MQLSNLKNERLQYINFLVVLGFKNNNLHFFFWAAIMQGQPRYHKKIRKMHIFTTALKKIWKYTLN